MRSYAPLLLFMLLTLSGGAQQPCRIVSWNVENFFDTQNDTLTNDDDFTPKGSYHWNQQRFVRKRDNIYKTLVAIGGDNSELLATHGEALTQGTTDGDTMGISLLNMPVAIGLMEVENEYVLDQLRLATPLRKYHYQSIWFDSPDLRGIDCALLYREDRFYPLYAKAIPANTLSGDTAFHSRDILLVKGVVDNKDTLYLLVNHWPSRRGGTEADQRRNEVAQLLRTIMDTIVSNSPHAAVLAMGDFNAEPSDPAMVQAFGFSDSTGCNDMGWIDMAAGIQNGTYFYQGKWSCIDQMILAGNCHLTTSNIFRTKRPCTDGMHIFSADFLLRYDLKNLCYKPFRTYLGPRYQGGFSDHLPIYIDLYL